MTYRICDTGGVTISNTARCKCGSLSRVFKPLPMNLSTHKKYISILAELKDKIRQARRGAVRAADERLLNLYWDIGNIILQQQKEQGWGTKVIKRLALDLQSAFPNTRGFSERNLVNKQVFASTYPDYPFLYVAGRATNRIESNTHTQAKDSKLQSDEIQKNMITQPLVAQIPWYSPISISIFIQHIFCLYLIRRNFFPSAFN